MKVSVSEKIKNVAVYCGSRSPSDPAFDQAVVHFGEFLADHHIRLIYGGSYVGTMKILADSVLEHGGEATGIFSETVHEKKAHPQLTERIDTATLAERKREMLARADAVVALPGGLGTLDELFDAIALRRVGKNGHHKPIGLLNVKRFYDPLLAFISHTVDLGFTSQEAAAMIHTAETPEELFTQLSEEIETRK